MNFKPLFSTPNGMQILQKGINFTRTDGRVAASPKLHEALRFIAANAERFDRNCQINVEWIGDETLGRISDLGPPTESDDIKMLTAIIFRFASEYDMSVKEESSQIHSFMRAVRSDLGQYPDESKSQIEFAQQDMAVAIVKKIITSDDFVNIRNMPEVASHVESKITGWQTILSETEKKATRLGEVLQEQTQAFNFVGLHKGFSELADDIKDELSVAQRTMIGFGTLVLLPATTEFLLISSGRIDLSKLPIPALIALGLATVAITLLLLYFFRIALRKADACRAQLIQVRLRMSLCRFIQSYADYSGEFKGKNEGALAKFESLIFSGIVSSDEKLPSTFDGVEQLASLAKSITGKS